ncbi:hypothetical protein ACFOWE_13515 [Planomonospora corallina]|uniref:Secreted protein n=1 Tax=Planomonospora corallina TaxID=1806052 RepID=A0ABV8I8B2_9ACTN
MAAVLAVLVFPNAAHASSGSVFNGDISGGADFSDGGRSGEIESIYVYDYKKDGYGVRARSWVRGSYLRTFDYAGGANGGELFRFDLVEFTGIDVDVCSRDSVSGVVRTFNCGGTRYFYA